MLLVDDLAAGGTKNLRHTPRGLVTLLKEAKKNYMGRLIFPGGRGPFAYSYENLYIL